MTSTCHLAIRPTSAVEQMVILAQRSSGTATGKKVIAIALVFICDERYVVRLLQKSVCLYLMPPNECSYCIV